MTQTERDEWRRLAEAATPGPWVWDAGEGHDMPILRGPVDRVCDFGDDTQYYPTEGTPPSAADAAYIAHSSPDRVLALLEEVERLRAALQALRHTVMQADIDRSIDDALAEHQP